MSYNSTVRGFFKRSVMLFFFARIGYHQTAGNKSPTGSISLLLNNVMIMIVTGTHSVCFAKRQTYFLGLNLSFFRKACSEKSS